MTSHAYCPRLRGAPGRRRPAPRRVSLVAATLARHGATEIDTGRLTQVRVDSTSRIIATAGGAVWCRTYRGLEGLFRKDRGPSKEFGRALCDEVKARFGCDGFFTTDELPRYGISRRSRRQITQAAGATPDDCVVIFAYDEALARSIDAYLADRLAEMS